MSENQRVSDILKEAGIPDHGYASFQSVLPLLECRAKSRLPQDAQSVIVCIFPYHVKEPQKRNISRYAMVEDYHVVVSALLTAACNALSEAYPTRQFAPFVDNSPIREVAAAVAAGLGVQGQNGLLLHPRYGSFVFIGEIVTDLPLDTQQKAGKCIDCGRCVAACPAHAIGSEGVKQEKCLSHITQKKGELTPKETALIQTERLLWGCDICQEVCPYNQELPETPLAAFREGIEPYVSYERIEELVKVRAFGFRGSKVIKRNYEILYGKQE